MVVTLFALLVPLIASLVVCSPIGDYYGFLDEEFVDGVDFIGSRVLSFVVSGDHPIGNQTRKKEKRKKKRGDAAGQAGRPYGAAGSACRGSREVFAKEREGGGKKKARV